MAKLLLAIQMNSAFENSSDGHSAKLYPPLMS